LPFIPDNQAKMPAALVANLINLGHSEKLMISELKKRVAFASRFKFKVENVFVKRLRLSQIINLDRHMIAPIDLNAHIPPLCAVQRSTFNVQRSVVQDSVPRHCK
jgi:hypothetical protein